MIYICHIVAVSNPVVDIGPENRIIASKGAGKVQAVPVLPCDVGQVYLETKYWSLNYIFLNAGLPCQLSPVGQDVLIHKSGFPLEHTCQIWENRDYVREVFWQRPQFKPIAQKICKFLLRVDAWICCMALPHPGNEQLSLNIKYQLLTYRCWVQGRLAYW